MTITKRAILILILATVWAVSSMAQSDIQLKLSTLATNLNPEGDGSSVIFEPGLIFSYDLFFRDRSTSLRLTQGIRMNEHQKLAGYTSAKFHIALYQKWKNEINVGLGTMIAYQQPHKDHPSEKFDGSEGIAMGDLGITGSIEYTYSLRRNTDLSFSIDHVYPVKVFLNAGIRFWISKKIKKRKKCMTCPDWG